MWGESNGCAWNHRWFFGALLRGDGPRTDCPGLAIVLLREGVWGAAGFRAAFGGRISLDINTTGVDHLKVLVTGATGNVGRMVVDQLRGSGVEVRALTNNPSKAALPADVEVVEGYLGRLSIMPAALEGVERMYLAPLPQTARDVVELAARLGVRRIVALSSTEAELEAQGDPSTWYYYAVEVAVEAAAGVERTHLRAGEFMTNMLDWAESIRTEGVVRAAYGKAAFAPIDMVDIAAVAARVLLTDGHHGAKYELTGPESLSKLDRMRIIGEVIGREIQFEELTHEEARETLIRRDFGEVADWLLDGEAQGVVHPQLPSPTVAELLGRPARTFAEWVADNAAAFR